jgi:hypothetical protein
MRPPAVRIIDRLHHFRRSAQSVNYLRILVHSRQFSAMSANAADFFNSTSLTAGQMFVGDFAMPDSLPHSVNYLTTYKGGPGDELVVQRSDWARNMLLTVQ